MITVAILLAEPLSYKLDSAGSVKDIYILELLERNQRNERTILPSLKRIWSTQKIQINNNISYIGAFDVLNYSHQHS